MAWDRHAWDRELGRRDRAELLDPPPRQERAPVRHSAGCYDDEGKLECVGCNGGLWHSHPDWDRP